jgi:hypothetical protein
MGEWAGLESHTSGESQAIAISESRLRAEQGPMARSTQSLLIDRLTLD